MSDNCTLCRRDVSDCLSFRLTYKDGDSNHSAIVCLGCACKLKRLVQSLDESTDAHRGRRDVTVVM